MAQLQTVSTGRLDKARLFLVAVRALRDTTLSVNVTHFDRGPVNPSANSWGTEQNVFFKTKHSFTAQDPTVKKTWIYNFTVCSLFNLGSGYTSSTLIECPCITLHAFCRPDPWALRFSLYLAPVHLGLLLAALPTIRLELGEAELPEQVTGTAQQVAGETQLPASLRRKIGTVCRQLKGGKRTKKQTFS